MAIRWSRWAAGIAALVLSAGEVRPGDVPGSVAPVLPQGNETHLSIMSYNVKGLPWPAAQGRTENLLAIGRELAAQRWQGRQPHIVLLQEAFTSEAKAIGRAAGYRYVASGPRAGSVRYPAQPTLGKDFAAAATRLRGEGVGSWIDSGLVVLSDYPIVTSEDYAFPADACAGYDCLANKGVMLVRLAVPGSERPLVVVNTHLNLDASSTGVGPARSDAVFAWQYRHLQQFVRSRAPADSLIVVAGDFNVGPAAQRRSTADRIGPPLSQAKEAVSQALHIRNLAPTARAAAQAIAARRIDGVYYRGGGSAGLSLEGFDVPFPLGGPDSLSDHAGFVATFRISS